MQWNLSTLFKARFNTDLKLNENTFDEHSFWNRQVEDQLKTFEVAIYKLNSNLYNIMDKVRVNKFLYKQW